MHMFASKRPYLAQRMASNDGGKRKGMEPRYNPASKVRRGSQADGYQLHACMHEGLSGLTAAVFHLDVSSPRSQQDPLLVAEPNRRGYLPVVHARKPELGRQNSLQLQVGTLGHLCHLGGGQPRHPSAVREDVDVRQCQTVMYLVS